jgi:hypothetical protein
VGPVPAGRALRPGLRRDVGLAGHAGRPRSGGSARAMRVRISPNGGRAPPGWRRGSGPARAGSAPPPPRRSGTHRPRRSRHSSTSRSPAGSALRRVPAAEAAAVDLLEGHLHAPTVRLAPGPAPARSAGNRYPTRGVERGAGHLRTSRPGVPRKTPRPRPTPLAAASGSGGDWTLSRPMAGEASKHGPGTPRYRNVRPPSATST